MLETVSFDLTGKKTIKWEIRFLMFAIIEFIASELAIELLKNLHSKTVDDNTNVFIKLCF